VSVVGARSARSLGVSRYVDRLSAALRGLGVAYEPRERPSDGEHVHFHLANSSRRSIWQAPRRPSPFVLTIHDVAPRTAALEPLYHAVVYPFVAGRAAATIVHSRFAADLLVARSGRIRGRLEIIGHPAAPLAGRSRAEARARLGWPAEVPIAVLPGVIKRAKLVEEAVAAAAPLIADGRWRLALVGPVQDRTAALTAQTAGAWLVERPDHPAYEDAIVASDLVLVLRSRSVGETNGPLLDALGAGRAVLASKIGSIPEVAGEAARYCTNDASGIRAALTALADPSELGQRERTASDRGAALTWPAAAAAHAEIFREAFGV
jgi:glycosyltransferase involved in cell wall biosynthesis